MNRTIYVLCILLAVSQAAQALSYSTAERTFAHHLSSYATIFSLQHEGRAPSSWADIETCIDRPIDGAYSYITPTKRYAFLSQPLHLPPPYDGDLLIITRRPFRDGRLYTNLLGGISHGLREPGRYIIFRRANGSFEAAYVDEAFVQRAFHGSESLLPTPDSEPMRRREVKALCWSVLTWSAAGITVVFLVRRFFRRATTRPDNGRSERTRSPHVR